VLTRVLEFVVWSINATATAKTVNGVPYSIASVGTELIPV